MHIALMDSPLYPIAQAGFLVLTLVFLWLLIREFQKAAVLAKWENGKRRAFITQMVVTLLVWALFVSGWSLSGKMADFSLFPFNLLPVLVIPAIVGIIFISSKKTGELLKRIPPENIVRLQGFRFGVEVLLWMLFVAEMLPEQMTFEGRNFDILAGFSAPIVAVLVSKGTISRTGVIVWNILCLVLLLNIVTIAILSTPSPFRVFMNDPPNYVVTLFPISWLPGFLVPLAYYLHFISLRQMRQKRN
jgi:hypothetical protein